MAELPIVGRLKGAGRLVDSAPDHRTIYEAADLIIELAAALEPFEKEAARHERLVLGQDIDDWKLTTTELTMGNLRRARDILIRARRKGGE